LALNCVDMELFRYLGGMTAGPAMLMIPLVGGIAHMCDC
jgi:hypothetical protein